MLIYYFWFLREYGFLICRFLRYVRVNVYGGGNRNIKYRNTNHRNKKEIRKVSNVHEPTFSLSSSLSPLFSNDKYSIRLIHVESIEKCHYVLKLYVARSTDRSDLHTIQFPNLLSPSLKKKGKANLFPSCTFRTTRLRKIRRNTKHQPRINIYSSNQPYRPTLDTHLRPLQKIGTRPAGD